MIPILCATFVAVFIAEIACDKLLYTTGVLSARYCAAPIFFGMLLAFMSKMAVAVAVGKAISELPPLFVVTLTSASFIGAAIALWLKPEDREVRRREQGASSTAIVVSFATIFFSEWGDVGQITAATMAARFGAPVTVWAGAVAAMVTKGALATSIGASVREGIANKVSPRIARTVGVTLLLLLGALSVMESLTEHHG